MIGLLGKSGIKVIRSSVDQCCHQTNYLSLLIYLNYLEAFQCFRKQKIKTPNNLTAGNSHQKKINIRGGQHSNHSIKAVEKTSMTR